MAGPDVKMDSVSWISSSVEATERMGEILGSLLQAGDVVALEGELGAGKTVLVRGVAAGLGCDSSAVHSPSFTLANEYACHRRAKGGPVANMLLAHLDLYRIRSEEELPGIGWDGYMHSRSVVVVEWADRAGGWLPRDHLRVRLEVLEGDHRRLQAEPMGLRSRELLGKWVESPEVVAASRESQQPHSRKVQ